MLNRANCDANNLPYSNDLFYSRKTIYPGKCTNIARKYIENIIN